MIRVDSYAFSSTQKILKHARMAEMGLYKPDALNESIGLELDMLNILYETFFTSSLALTQ
jgi:hypothetical protein